MVLTDREIVINLAKNIDEETLALVDVNKLNEIADDAIVKGIGSAKSWSTSVNWEAAEAQNHPSLELYKELYQIYAAIHLLMRISDYKDETFGYMEIAEKKGALLAKAVKEFATFGLDQGVSKLRSIAVSSQKVTFPSNLGVPPYHSPNFLNRRRGRL